MRAVAFFAAVGLAAAGSAPTLKKVKAEVVSSQAFQKHIDAAMPVFCKGAHKQAECKSFVEDAIFCLDFAKNAAKFESVPGAEDEKKHCETIDTQLPNLSMLQAIIADPVAHRRQVSMIQQTIRIQTCRPSLTARRS